MILQKAVEYGFPAEEREGLEICSLKKYNFFLTQSILNSDNTTLPLQAQSS